MLKRLSLFICIFFTFGLRLLAQNGYVEYIEKYKAMAVEQMHRHGVPASITMAQALLESGAGRSTLAVKANNHFGIKVGTGWTGPYMLKDDDERNERFRKYNDVAHSYEDHSLFLKRPRYASLFNLHRTDYKGWAKGLKAAGYATNPAYATRLIDLIERFDLARLDYMTPGESPRLVADVSGLAPTAVIGRSEMSVHRCNDNYYVIASDGDTYASISKAMDVSERKLRRYNEVSKHHQLMPGDVVFLEKKSKKVAKSLKGTFHIVRAGESLHSIAQTYGVRMKTLYKLNHLPKDYLPSIGASLKLR